MVLPSVHCIYLLRYQQAVVNIHLQNFIDGEKVVMWCYRGTMVQNKVFSAMSHFKLLLLLECKQYLVI